MARDYKDEYKKFQGTEKQKKLRVIRNRNRRKLERCGVVKKGDGKDIHHVGDVLTVMDSSKNRGILEKSRLKKSKRKKHKLNKT
jgi:hypothetical protein|tara:strand:- start:443 stop:694 length:252 start_codon:yes stop_codon:yes gene_type:complete